MSDEFSYAEPIVICDMQKCSTASLWRSSDFRPLKKHRGRRSVQAFPRRTLVAHFSR